MAFPFITVETEHGTRTIGHRDQHVHRWHELPGNQRRCDDCGAVEKIEITGRVVYPQPPQDVGRRWSERLTNGVIDR